MFTDTERMSYESLNTVLRVTEWILQPNQPWQEEKGLEHPPLKIQIIPIQLTKVRKIKMILQ